MPALNSFGTETSDGVVRAGPLADEHSRAVADDCPRRDTTSGAQPVRRGFPATDCCPSGPCYVARSADAAWDDSSRDSPSDDSLDGAPCPLLASHATHEIPQAAPSRQLRDGHDSLMPKIPDYSARRSRAPFAFWWLHNAVRVPSAPPRRRAAR